MKTFQMRTNIVAALHRALLACSAATVLIGTSAHAQPCDLYPIALSAQTLSNVAPNTVINDILNGTQSGNSGWLTWGGSPSEPTLVTSLTPPANSSTYVNPDNTSDHQVSVGDWVAGKPGVSNSKNVRDALDVLKNIDITVPVWDQTRGQGANAAYRIAAFARVRLIGYHLPGQNRISARFLGYTSCSAQNIAPVVNAGPDLTNALHTLPATLTLNGGVTDDGLPIGGTLTTQWSKLSGPGTVTFGNSNVAMTTATFELDGTYVLQLYASDSQLDASDTVTVTINRENQPPIAYPTNVVSGEDVPLNITLLGTDPEGDPLEYPIVTPPSFGTLTGSGSNVVYTPKPDYNGPDEFTFRVFDGYLESSNAVVTITVQPVNDAPVADSNSVTNNEDATFPIALSGSDVEGSPLTFTVLDYPTNGTLTTTSSNVVFYTPSNNFFGQDSFTFKVNDGELDSLPATTLIVIAPINDAPIVDAGPDQLISEPTNTVTLQGIVTDDEFPTAMADVIEWSFVSGPGAVTFGDSNQPITAVTFSTTGIYILRLTAHDSLLTNSDEITITVNALPIVNAGTDFTNTLPGVVTLNGFATDDGLPNGTLTLLWSKVSGPGSVLFADPATTNTTVEFSASGVYVLSLTASDSAASVSDEVTVTINRAPVVDAGSDQTNSTLQVQVHGSVADDGMPPGAIVTSLWEKVSGPGDVTFGDPAAPATTASFSVPGIYELRLSASDTISSGSNDVRLVINAVPVVNAGADQRVNFPGSVDLSATATDDGLPEGSTLTYQWTQDAGPGTVTFSDPASTETTTSFNQPGVYTLAFSASDSLTNDTDELIVIVNQPPTALAGANQLIAFGDLAMLNGSVSDDGLPDGVTNIFWSKFSGPGDVGFEDPASPITTAIFLESGVYVLHLTLDDTMATNTSAVTITVNAAPTVTVSASNSTVRLPTPAHLLAIVNDDGLPTGTLNGTWTKVSGPGDVAFGDANATGTTVSFDQAGSYVLRFTASDTVATGSAELTITVLPANIPPVAELLACNERVYAAGETVVLGADAYDTDGQVVQVEFVQNGTSLGIVTNEPFVFEWSNAPGGVHTVAVIATDDLGGTTTSAAVAVTVSAPPVIALSSPGGILFSPGATITLSAEATDNDGGVAKVEFFDGPTKLGEDISQPFEFTWSSAAAGVHVVMARATDNLGLSTVSAPVTLKVNEAPLVLITAPVTSGVVAGDQPMSIVAAASDRDGLVNKVEFFVDGQFVGEAVASPYRLTWSPPFPGDYFLTAVATDNDGRTATDAIIFHVNAAPIVTISQPAASAVFQLGEPVVIQVSADDFDGTIGRIEYLESSVKLCADTPVSTTLTLANVAPGTHTYSVRAKDDFADLSATESVTIFVNNPPFVRIDSPAHGTVYTNAGDITLVASAGDSDGSITKVEFYEGSTLLGEGTAQGGTYSLLWSNVPAGAHQVTTKSYDNQGGTASASISLYVNSAPIVDAGPDQTITLPAQVVLQGSVIDDGLLAGRLTTTWTQISGPGTVTFPCVCSVLATGAFSTPGVYVLRLTADDGLVSVSDDLTVVVNRRPFVNAGFDQMITLPNVAQLKGTWIDDGMPPGATVSSIWTKVSGTGTVTFADATVTNTTATFTKPGPYEPPANYVLRLTVSDTLTNVTDDVIITVNPPNQAPIVNAGPDQVIAPGSQFLLRGEVTDDGWPLGVVTSRWTQVSGPGTTQFGNPIARVTTVTFSARGTYVLRLMAGDTELEAADEVTITVDESNRAPLVNVGPNRSLVLPNALPLSATVLDDALPVGSTVSVTWSQVSGPASVMFDNANSASTSAYFTSNGVYVLQLAATDSELTGIGQLTVSVVPGTNQPPLVDAGPDRTILQPLDATGTNQGKIFVIDDEISLSNDGQGYPGPRRFATNLAKWFTGGMTGKFLAYSANPGLNGTLLRNLMTNAGSWTVSTNVPFTVSNLLQYHAVYLAGDPADNQVLIDYVRAGGNVYLAGGTAVGSANAVLESARWSTFLNTFGFNFKDSYNSHFGFITVNSKDPIFTGVPDLWHREGNYVQELLPSSPITDLLDTFAGEGLFGVYHNPYPLIVLQGSIVDDGQPPGSPLTLAWSKVSGPGTVFFGVTNSATTTAAFSEAGTYVLRLTASNAGVTAADEVTVTVERNEPPAVNAGPNLTTTVWDVISLPGSVSDDGLPTGATLEHSWAKISGPGTVTFGDAAPVTTARFSMAGTYVLRLMAGDSQTFAGDNMIVSVINSTNTPPSVLAGTLTSRVYWPSNGLITGIVSDDGFPLGEPLTVTWSKVSGPGEVRFDDATTMNTSVSFSTNGVYWLRLTANDSQLSAFNDVQIIVDLIGNAAPVVDTGTNQVITTLSTTLFGSVTDDGYPVNGALRTFWTKVGGPASGIVTFGNSNAPVTTVYFSQPGGYTLRLTATDGQFTTMRDMTVSMVNQAPWVNAGPDRAIALPQTNLTLNGIVIDDGLPGTNLYPTWSKVSGPGNVTWGGSYSGNFFPLTVNPSFSMTGTYVLRLSAHDGSLTSTDDVRVVVGPATNQAPSVNAGADQIVTLSTNAFSLGGIVADDGGPAGATNISWSLVRGPAPVIFGSSNAAATTVNFTALGIYVLRLAADDTVLTNGDDLIITVKAPINQAPVVDAGPNLTIRLFELATLNGSFTDDGLPEGTSRTALWRKISGPDQVTLGSPIQFGVSTSAVTTATFRAIGTYVLRLFVDDGGTNSFDDVTVTVVPDNLAPLVNAGPDQTVVLPRFAVLNGQVSDDGVPTNATLDVAWSKVSGPGTVSFYDPNAPVTMASFSVQGTYVLRLTATDSEFTGVDELTLIVRTNGPPIVNAGPDRTNSLNNTIVLNGTGTEDGLPSGFLVFQWSKVNGPGLVSFANPALTNTAVSFSAPGTYVLRLTAMDFQSVVSDTVVLTITSATNKPPLVLAGADQTIVLPSLASLAGAVSDDGLPAGVLSAVWSQSSGPGSVTFLPGLAPTSPQASFSTSGVYVLRLTANDSAATSSDELTVRVYPEGSTNQAPLVDAGTNQRAIFPNAITLNGSANDDGLPGGTLTFAWSKVSGPGTVTFSNANALSTPVTFSDPGTYVLELAVSDSALTGFDQVTVQTESDPGTFPTVEILLPDDGLAVTAPSNVIGTVQSPILQSYQLQYRFKTPDDSGAWITLATGTDEVSAGTVGRLDPTLLLNGIYELQLSATDLAGRTGISEPITLVVDRNMKVGHFRLTFNDLSMPVAGIHIEVIRTYDSRDKRVGDFGVGWNLDLKNIRLQKNRNLGSAWEQLHFPGGFGNYCLDSRRPRIVTITFPDGQTHKFKAKTDPDCQFFQPIQAPTVVYEPLANTHGRLVSLAAGGDEVLVPPSVGETDLFDYQGNTYNPTLFQYTSVEGVVYVIHEHDGLRTMTDRNGNRLSVDFDGITWTNTVTGGPSTGILFQRDQLGRITNIVDAAGSTISYRYDTNGNLVEFVDRANATNTLSYNAPNELLTVIDARGITSARNEYDDSGRLIRQVDAAGNTNTFMHDLDARAEIIRDRRGFLTIQEYDQNGNITRTIDALNNVTRMTYDANDNLLMKVDALGNTNRFTYDSRDNKLTEVDPLGNTTTYTYNEFSEVTSIRNARGFVSTNVYDTEGNLLEERDPLGNRTLYTYDEQGNMLVRTDALGNTVENAYDQFGHVTNTVTRDVNLGVLNTTAFAYDANGNQTNRTTWRTTPTGVEPLVTTSVYDRENRLILTIHPDGSTNANIYNSIDKIEVEIDAIGRRIVHDYDERRNLARTTYPDSTFEITTFDAENRVVARQDKGGRITGYTNDPIGRLTQITFADGFTSNVVYDAIDRIIATADERGNTTRFAYDPNCGCSGRQAFITNALGQVTHNNYDENGNVTATLDARQNMTQFFYDALDRRTNVLFPDGTRLITVFDALGRRVAETDQNTNTIHFAYDALGRLRFVTNALGHTSRYDYDEASSLIAQMDANQHITRHEYDQLGRRTKRTLPLLQSESYAYDPAGRMTNRTDFNGYVTSYAYDAMNRLIAKVPDSLRNEPSHTFAYNAMGLRTNMNDASGATFYHYDVRDRLVLKATPQGTMAYSNDAAGNVLSIHSLNANGVAMFYQHDALNRVTNVFDPHNGPTAYAYDAVGNLDTYRYPNGVLTVMAYDSLNRLTNMGSVSPQWTPLSAYAYRRAATGHKLSVAELTGRSVEYGYDATYRLASETISAPLNQPAGVVGYVLDDVGNRLQRNSTVLGISTTAQTYDANDRLTSDQHDANGNITSSAGNMDAYDFEDRLIRRNNGQVQIVYDGDGNRVRESVNGITTLFLVDDRNPTGYAQVLDELTLNPSDPNFTTPQVTHVYVYGIDLISQERLVGASWQVTFYGYDGHGNTRFLTDSQGATTDSYDYDAFGSVLTSTGSTPNRYLYTGEQFDHELGLYYLRARYMSAASGRFHTRDTFEGDIALPSSLNGYVYAHADPVNGLDPSGYSLMMDWLGGSSLSVDLRKNQSRNSYKQARRVAARLCAVASKFLRPYNEAYAKITKGSPFQAHHIQQNALMEGLALTYERGLGLSVALLGGSHVAGSPHDMANKSQGANKGKSLRFITYEALRAAGCRKRDATEITLAAENYSKMMGW